MRYGHTCCYCAADLRPFGNIFDQNAGTVGCKGVTRPSMSANKLELLVLMSHELAGKDRNVSSGSSTPPSWASGWSSRHHTRHGASRVACVSLVYMLSPLPRHRDWRHCFAHSPSPISLPRNGGQVGLCIGIFEACSAFTRVTACTLAGSSEMTRYIRGSSHFVTSMTAPIASGWSEIAGWVSHPLGKRRLCTAHARTCRSRMTSERQVCISCR